MEEDSPPSQKGDGYFPPRLLRPLFCSISVFAGFQYNPEGDDKEGE
jgi:hypothetical protein